MRATIVDLRYRMKSVLKAVERNEIVDVYSHGVPKARIVPLSLRVKPPKRMQDHPFFGMTAKTETEPVPKVMQRLRGGRYRDL